MDHTYSLAFAYPDVAQFTVAALVVPIYAIVGQRPIKLIEVVNEQGDEVSDLQVWDFDAGEFVRGGGDEWDAFSGREAPGGGEDALRGDVPHQGGMDVRYVSEAEFEEYVETLRKAAEESSDSLPRDLQGD